MTAPSNEGIRIKQRFNVGLKAEITFAGNKAKKYQCSITNLSASGACLHFKPTAPCKTGISFSIKILIPETIMHIPNKGKIIWVKQHPNEMHAGIEFDDVLSEIMMQRLVENLKT